MKLRLMATPRLDKTSKRRGRGEVVRDLGEAASEKKVPWLLNGESVSFRVIRPAKSMTASN